MKVFCLIERIIAHVITVADIVADNPPDTTVVLFADIRHIGEGPIFGILMGIKVVAVSFPGCDVTIVDTVIDLDDIHRRSLSRNLVIDGS
jgi:hypothetical protein